MRLTKLYKYDYNQKHGSLYCPKCEDDFKTYCSECDNTLVYCNNCGEEIVNPEVRIIHTEEYIYGYHGLPSLTISLMIDGEKYAYAYFDRKASTDEASFVNVWLCYFHESKQTNLTATIISDFAEWARSKWSNYEIQGLETHVRLMGYKHDSRNTFPCPSEDFVVLGDATKITKEHLPYEATLGSQRKDVGMNKCYSCNIEMDFDSDQLHSMHSTNGFLWVCEECGEYFCSLCFVEKLGRSNWHKNFEQEAFNCHGCFSTGRTVYEAMFA